MLFASAAVVLALLVGYFFAKWRCAKQYAIEPANLDTLHLGAQLKETSRELQAMRAQYREADENHAAQLGALQIDIDWVLETLGAITAQPQLDAVRAALQEKLVGMKAKATARRRLP